MADIDAEKPGGWRSDAGFIELARLVQEQCDPRPPFDIVPHPEVFSNISYKRFLEAPEEYVEKLPPKVIGPGRRQHTRLLHTPQGDLEYTFLKDDDVETEWDVHRPITCPNDVEKMLSVPWKFTPPDTKEFEPFRAHRREMNGLGLGGDGITSMVAMLCGMMEFEQLLEWVLTERTLLKALADAWLDRMWKKTEFLMSQGVGPFWHFNGVERASPPMMGPKQWEEWVLPYDGELMRRIKEKDPGAIIHVHCHGKVGTLLESFIHMGVNSTDPVEPPHQGDIEFAQAKRLASGRMTLYGNIEFVWMEMAEPSQIEEYVKRAILEGGKERMVLYPSATPHERHTKKFLANAERYIEAGIKYGAY